MLRKMDAGGPGPRHVASFLAGAALASLGLCGCGGFWDTVTSREPFSDKMHALFVKPNPLVVLRDSTDGDKRAAALRSLREPKLNGGTDQDQETVLKILATAATTERQALCRMAAIESLSQFQDARAVEGLIEAYYRADAFTPETATLLRCQAVAALGGTRNAVAVDFLAKVVREPAVEGSQEERQQAMDVRIAAARALGNFSHYQGTEALVRVLQSEKDVALRNRAHESLQLATGKKLPPDPQAWEEALRQGSSKDAVATAGNGPWFKLTGFFQKP